MGFPTSPTHNQVYVAPSGTTYVYSQDGNKWIKPYTTTVPPIIGKSFVFDGVDEGLEGLSTDGVIGTGGEDFAMAAWVKLSAQPSATYIIQSSQRGTGFGDFQWAMQLGGAGYFNFEMINAPRSGRKDYSAVAAGALDDETWHHLCAVAVNSGSDYTLDLYVDGVLITPTKNVDTTMTSLASPVAAKLMIGARDDAAGPQVCFPGSIAVPCCFHDTTFTSSEVAELYNGGTLKNPNAHSRKAKLLWCYTFDDPADDATADTGTIVNTSNGFNSDLTPRNTEVSDIVSDVP